MARTIRTDPEITKYIIQKVEEHPNDIASITAKHFSVTRNTINRYLKKLISERQLLASGKTKARQYKLYTFTKEQLKISLAGNPQEDIIWREKLLPYFESIKKNVINICHYGVPSVPGTVRQNLGNMKTMRALRNSTSWEQTLKTRII